MKIGEDYYKQNNLREPYSTEFSEDRNLIIGPNGGGKTRLLKAVMKYYENERTDYSVVFADFPHLTYGGEIYTPVRGEGAEDSDETEQQDGDDAVQFLLHNTAHIPFKTFMQSVNNNQSLYIQELFAYKNRISKAEKKLWKSLVKSLNKFLEATLGFHFDPDKEVITVKDEDKSSEEFQKYLTEQASPGERNLFYISIFLAAFYTYRKESKLAFFLDEPELHLHMGKVIDFIKIIRDEFKSSVLWVATHSIHLIPLFDFKQTVYIENGSVQPRNNKGGGYYASIKNSLTGTAADLSDFLRNITEWETYGYFEQCLFEEPETAAADGNDLQLNEIKTLIEDRLNASPEPFHILDYGAGQGRFGTMLDGIYNGTEAKKIYSTFDLDGENFKQYIKGKIKCHNRHYTKEDVLPENEFDFVLLVSTLHEIPPNEWIDAMRRIYKALKDGGRIIFCEAAVLTNGEYLGKDYGYLVLADKSFACMFGSGSEFKLYKNKIRIAQIDKPSLEIFNAPEAEELLKETFQTLANEAFESYLNEIRIRDEDKDKEDKNSRYVSGRKLAFFAAQHMNALWAVKDMALIVARDEAALDGKQNFTIDGDCLVGYTGNGGDVVIPKGIARIADKIQWNCLEEITSIRIPSSCVSIGIEAFMGMKALKDIFIPDTVKEIGPSAFEDCISLKSIKLPKALESLSENLFYFCTALEEVHISSHVIKISNMAFGGCESLKKLILPKGIQAIESEAFYCCRNLALLEFAQDDSIAENKNYQFIDGVLFNKDCTELLYYPAAKHGGVYTVPSSVKTISKASFSSNKYLSNIALPISLEKIESMAFYSSQNLTAIYIPEKTVITGIFIFSFCRKLDRISLPRGIEEINDYMFQSSSSLTEVKLPESVKVIGKDAFKGCLALTSINIPNSVTKIDTDSFSGANKVTFKCSIGSYADGYAKEHGIKVEYISSL